MQIVIVGLMCLLILLGVYVDFCPIIKWYIIVVTWAPDTYIYTFSPRALGIRIRQTTYMLVTALQLYNIAIY